MIILVYISWLLSCVLLVLILVIDFSNRIGNERPKVAVLSATEEILDSVPSSLDANEITKLAK